MQRDVIHVSLTLFQKRASGIINMLIRPGATVLLLTMFASKPLVAAITSASAGRKDKALLKALFKTARGKIDGLPKEERDLKNTRLDVIEGQLSGLVETILIPDEYERGVALNSAMNATNDGFQDGITSQFAGMPVHEISCLLALTAEQTVAHRMPRVMLFRDSDIEAYGPLIEADNWQATITLSQPHHVDRLTTMLKIALLHELEELAEIPEQSRHVRKFRATVRA